MEITPPQRSNKRVERGCWGILRGTEENEKNSDVHSLQSLKPLDHLKPAVGFAGVSHLLDPAKWTSGL